MKSCAKLGLVVLIACFFTVGIVGAVSEWKFGETVQLIVTTTNMGDVDVVRSTGTISIRDPRGVVFYCDTFDVEGVVHPGEAVRVPVSWNTGVTNATLVPGYHDIILDGELSYANGEYEETHSEVNDAFLLYLGSTGLRELPEVMYEAEVTGITQLSDTYYPGSPFVIIVWVNNTGSSLFIPEIQVSFTCDEDYTFEPEPQCYYEDVCTPGSHPYMYQCQLPEDMPVGTCEYDVDLQMYCIDVEVTDENYPDGLAGFWYDYYVISEAGSGLEDEVFKFSPMDERGVMIEESGWGGDYFGYYDVGMYLEDAGYWPDDDLGYGYCFQWFNNGVQNLPDPDMEKFCEESGYNDSLYYRFIDDLESESQEVLVPWEWTPTFGDEGYHNVEVELRERTVDYNLGGAWVLEDEIIPDEPFPVYILIENSGGFAFQPEFVIDVIDLDIVPVLEYNTDAVAPIGNSIHEIDVTIPSVTLPIDSLEFEFRVNTVQIFDATGNDVVTDALNYRFLLDDHTSHSYEEWGEMQEDYVNSWNWAVSDADWQSDTTHTILVEVTDDLDPWAHSGDGDRIGYASLDVTITADDDVSEGETDDSTGNTGGEDPSGDNGDSGTTPGSESEDWEEPEDEMGEGGISDMIQSFIDQILEILRGILG